MMPPWSSSSSEYFGFMSGRGPQVARKQFLERLSNALPVHQQLAHVADVEQAGILRVHRCSAMMPSYWTGIS
jgi:hypothetical protein